MNPKVVQVSINVGHTGLACTGFLEIPDGVDMGDLQSRLSSLNRYSGDSHIQSTRFNFVVVDRPAPVAVEQPVEKAEPAKKSPAKKKAASSPPKKAAKKTTAKKSKGKSQQDLL